MAITKVSPDLLDLDAGITISVADNSDNLTLTSTDADANSGPNLRMYRNSSSPADSDAIGLIDFEGKNDAGSPEDIVYAAIDTRIVDASDGTEDGRIEIATILAGTAGVSRVLMDATETVFNDNSKDLDFRVESDNKTHALFVDGGTGNVGISAAPESTYVSASYPMLEIGHAMYGSGSTTGTGYFGVNTYLAADGNWKYKDTTGAFLVHPAQATLNFYHAASGSADSNISFSKTAQLDADGLKFGADTAAANALDDYEEGTCTMGIGASSSAPTVSLGNTTGYYTKIGNVVTVHWYSAACTVSNAGSGLMTLTGFPFTTKNSDAVYNLGLISHTNSGSNAFWASSTVCNAFYMNYNNTTAYPIANGTTSGVSIDTSGTKYIMIQVTYLAN